MVTVFFFFFKHVRKIQNLPQARISIAVFTVLYEFLFLFFCTKRKKKKREYIYILYIGPIEKLFDGRYIQFHVSIAEII